MLKNKLEKIYSDQGIIDKKLLQIEELFNHSNFDKSSKISLARCPGRISLSKHADYINSDLLYILDDRDVFVAGQLQETSEAQIKFYNSNHNFQDLNSSATELEKHLADKSQWYFYPLKIIQKLGITLDKTLVLNISSDLPTGSGLSSSHALMISSYLCLQDLFKLTPKTELELILFCQEIESERGFKSGLGDQSAQLLSEKAQFNFIKLFPELKKEHRSIPEGLGIITAPSFIKADKSLPEFSEANENIKKYKSINELAKKAGAEYLADLIYLKTEEEIYKFLEEIEDPKLQALALYGLAEAARVKDLKENGITLEKLGKHLKLSHKAEQRFELKENNWQSYHHSFKIDTSLKLEEQTGYYGASTLENDAIQELALSLDGVYGASISGAGLGGNDTIICDLDKAEAIKEALIQNYYLPRSLEEKARERVHISSFSAKASIMN